MPIHTNPYQAMNHLIILACLCLVPQNAQKPDVPDKSTAIELADQIQKLDWFPESSGGRLQQMASALEIGRRAKGEEDDNKASVMYTLAREHADKADEPRISHDFARAVSQRWKVPQDFLPLWHVAAIERASNESRISELAILMLEDVERLGPADPVQDWKSAFRDLQRLASTANSEHAKRAFSLTSIQINAWLWIAEEAAKKNSDAEAFRLILSGEVSDGLQRLVKSANSELAEVAAQVIESDAFSKSHPRLFDLLAASDGEAAKLSGQRIFESLLPELTVEQIEMCQPICFRMTEPLPLREDFSLPYHGILKNGYMPGASENKVPREFSFDENEALWVCKGRGTVVWPRLPFENYVQEIMLTVDEMGSTIKLALGTEDSTQIRLEKKDDRIRARLIRHLGGRYNWKGSRTFAVGEKLAVKFYRTPERMFAFVNGKQLNSRTFGLGWQKLRIEVGSNSKITVSEIKTRPWLPGDQEALRKLAGKEHHSIGLTMSRFRPPSHDDYQKYLNQCVDVMGRLEKGKAFITPQEIVMRPVAAARFKRSEDDRKVFISQDFHCSAHEITQRQFSEVMEFNPASAQGNPYLPVDNVTMAEANEFCEQLTEKLAAVDLVPEGYEYRLPTEAEWTLAAMADGESEFDVSEAEYWHWDTCNDGFRMVGTSSPSERGLYDMHGNVEELTLTQHDKRKASKETEELVDPLSLPTAKSHIVIKGGSWNVGAHLTNARRRQRRHQGRTPGRGFRVVLAPLK